VIFGGVVLTGAAELAAVEKPATASTVTAAAPSSAKRFVLRVIRSPFSLAVRTALPRTDVGTVMVE
jgi:hypothetical protein